FLARAEWLDDKVLGIAGDQYAGIAIIAGCAVFAQALYLLIANLWIRSHSRPDVRKEWRTERRRLDSVLFGLFVATAVLIGVPLLDLDPDIEDTATVAGRLLGVVCGALIILRVIGIAADHLLGAAQRTATKFDDQLIPLIRQTLTVFIVLVGVLFVLQNLDVDVGALIAGLGIGGLAVALAAQDTVKNLLGGIAVLADRPFQVGDWVVIGEVEGTVEWVGFRSTRLRTFKSSVVTVPNGRMIDTVIDNMGVRQFRRYDCTLRLQYTTPPEKVQAFVEGARAILQANESVRHDYYFVELEGLGESSLNVLLYCFFDAPDWNTELRAKHILNLDILRLAKALGIEWAYPTSTVHLEGWGSARVADGTVPAAELAAIVEGFGPGGRAGQRAYQPLTAGYEPSANGAAELGEPDDGG
ncbi:MAG: mechanosensitive ion channel family protein, partial [Gemmatimonadales bacterium]